VSVDRRFLIEHAGEISRNLRYAQKELDEETWAALLDQLANWIAAAHAAMLDETWRRSE
jgi:CheY-specific phosphatase CheX